jgi:hypothetical protein
MDKKTLYIPTRRLHSQMSDYRWSPLVLQRTVQLDDDKGWRRALGRSIAGGKGVPRKTLSEDLVDPMVSQRQRQYRNVLLMYGRNLSSVGSFSEHLDLSRDSYLLSD